MCFGKRVAEVLTNAQFETVSIFRNTLNHPQRDIDTVVHGDDFVAVAEDGQLDHFFSSSREFHGDQASREDRIRSLKHRKGAQACRPLERRRIHLGGGSKVDREADHLAELDWWFGSTDPWLNWSTPMPSFCSPLRDSNNTLVSTVQTLRTALRQRLQLRVV